MENYTTKAGKQLIQMLMFSLYNDQRIIYREYIQNAYDAINKAVNKGILSKIKDGIVNVTIDVSQRQITIRDNGIGIKANEVAQTLLNIADSQKDGINTAGQYGIGRLAGAGYCRWLRFKTSTVGEGVKSVVSFDVDFANQIINDNDYEASATEVIDLITKIETSPEEASEHYFEVVLEEVTPDYKDLLNPEKITEYLKEVSPIDYTLAFKNALLSPSLKKTDPDFTLLYNGIGNVTVCVNGTVDIRKRYGLKIDGTGDDIDSLEFFKVDCNDGQALAWGWYAVTPFTKQIPASDPNRGIRLRKHNIQLGTLDLLNKYFSEVRGNNYFYGEVFAVHPNLRPNSNRDGLAPTPETEELFGKLRLIFKDLGKLYQLANNAKNAVKKVGLAVDKLSLGIETDEQHVKGEIELAEKELNKVENSVNAQSQVAKRVIELHKERAKEKKSEIGQKSPKSKSTFLAATTKPVDIFSQLKGKYSESEIRLIRQVIAYMTTACPSSNKDLMEQLKIHAINQLMKS